MASSDPTYRDLQVEAALWNIRVDSATAEVASALSAVGVESLVLKGPALSDWYPDDSARIYLDGDLLVAPQRLELACETLGQLGFARKIDEAGLPDWWQEHASSWRRELDGVSIDLHRRLQGVRADPAEVWERLWSDREPLSVAGRPLQRLSAAGRALYVTLHAAHDGEEGIKARRHLEMALEHAPPPVWERAAALARDLDAVDAFSAGLQLAPGGAALADGLGLPANSSVEAAIRAATAPPVALGIEQLSSAGGRQRLQILLRKVVPPAGFVRHWWPPAGRNAGMLAIGYLYRPIWLLARTPAGYRAWRAARRQVEAQRSRADSSSR